MILGALIPELHVYSSLSVGHHLSSCRTCPPLHFVVLVALYQKKVIAQHDLQKWKRSAQNMHLDFIFDLCTKPSEDIATAADVLDMVGWKKEAEMLRGKLGLC